MQRAICEKCGRKQPVDWAPGDLCTSCGSAVRRELRCAWCVEWSPALKFCRACGCELVDETLYGAARLLKDAGVDRFALARRLHEMDAVQQADLNRFYDAQRVIAMVRVDEARLCEEYLLQQGFADSLEDWLIRSLPAPGTFLDRIAAGPKGPFVRNPELLPEIARHSPIENTRTMASVALLRLGRGGEQDLAAAISGLDAAQPVAAESAMAIAHWRARLHVCLRGWQGYSSSKLVRAARTLRLQPPLGSWAAAAVTLGLFRDAGGAIPAVRDDLAPGEREAIEELHPALRDGLGSSDPDLRLTCAMALPDDTIVAGELDSEDAEKREVACRFLMRIRSPELRVPLAEGPGELRAEILNGLSPPLPQALVEPVLSAVERGDAAARDKAVWLLQSHLNESLVGRLIGLGLREKDPGLLRRLLQTEALPSRKEVIRAVIGAGLLPELSNEFWNGPFEIDFSNHEFIEGACARDPDTLNTLITVALWQIERGCERQAFDIGRFLARAAFGRHPMNLRLRAYELLTDYRLRPLFDWLEPSVARRLFGGLEGLVSTIVPLIGDGGQLHDRVITDVYHGWEKLAPALGEHPAALKEFLAALHKCAKAESFPYLTAHTQGLVALAALHPEQTFPLLSDLLSDADLLQRCPQIPVLMLNEYGRLSEPLRGRPHLAGPFIEALTAHMKAGDSTDCRLIAMDMLAKVLTDFPECRNSIAEELAPMMADPDSRPDAGPPESLDHEVLLPDQPLPTLAEYAAYMKEAAANPFEAMARRQLSLDQYMSCVSAWCDLISHRDDVATRYALLCSR